MMIKINLLPIQGKGPTKVYTQLALMGIVLVLTILAIVYVWIRQSNEIEAKNQDIHLKRKKVQELQETIKKVNQFEAKRNLVKQKLKVIQDSRKFQRAAVQIMMESLRVVPDQVWLQNWKLDAPTFRVDGFGLSLTSVGNYLTALNQSELFDKVVLQQSLKTLVAGHEVYNFALVFHLNLEALDTPTKAEK